MWEVSRHVSTVRTRWPNRRLARPTASYARGVHSRDRRLRVWAIGNKALEIASSVQIAIGTRTSHQRNECQDSSATGLEVKSATSRQLSRSESVKSMHPQRDDGRPHRTATMTDRLRLDCFSILSAYGYGPNTDTTTDPSALGDLE